MHIPLLVQLKKSLPQLMVGAQNCSDKVEGAYTGEISTLHLKDAGADFVLVGHSERRQYFKESHEFLNHKIKAVQANHLTAVFCIGETLEQRQSGATERVVLEQLERGLSDIPLSHHNFMIAYEPVWAIGTGVVATPEQAQEVHATIRSWLKQRCPSEADKISILYGGSVKPSNIKELLAKPDIDGGLVGGASLKAQDFISMCQSAS
jgi:triosephosphate isomerase